MHAGRNRSAALWFFSYAWLRWTALLTAAAVGFLVSAAFSQDNKAGKAPKKETEDTTIDTTDGLRLALTYYPGANGKQTVPIVLLHMWKESRNDYKDLAPQLQKLGYAVIVPDLRGHGESTRLRGAGREVTLNADKMSPHHLPLMVAEDMMAVKRFLWERNNAGELNIDKLCIVGAEMGASVALNFASADAIQQDQNLQNRVFRADSEYKLGRFVKVLVLLSPERAFHGLPVLPALRHPVVQRDIAVMILVGEKDSKAMDEAKQIYALLKRHHAEPTGDDKDKSDKKTLWLIPRATSLQGTKLLDPKFKVAELIADFVDRRLVKSEESRNWKWLERKQPHQ